MKLTFSETLLASSIAASDLQMKNTTFTPTAYSYDAMTKSVTFSFGNALTDGNYTWTLPTGAVSDDAGNATTSPFSGSTFVLAGDVNRDHAVNFDDLLVLSQNYGGSGKTFSQGNFDYDAAGNVNFDDLLILSQRYGKTLFVEAPIAASHSAKPRVAKSVLT